MPNPTPSSSSSTTSPDSSEQVSTLQSLLADPSAATSEDYTLLLSSLSPTTASVQRALAFTLLAKLLLPSGGPPTSSTPASAPTDELAEPIDTWLSSTDQLLLCKAFAALSAIFELSPTTGIALVSRPHFADRVAEAVELSSITDTFARQSLSTKKGQAGKPDVDHALASFLSVALSSTAARNILINRFPSSLSYLASLSSPNFRASTAARCIASVAVTKLRLGGAFENDPTGEREKLELDVPGEEVLFGTLLKAFEGGKGDESVLRAAVEGFALLSLESKLKRVLGEHGKTLLPRFTELVRAAAPLKGQTGEAAQHPDSAMTYGVATTMYNLTVFKPLKTPDELAADRLRSLAAGKQKSNNSSGGNQSTTQEDEDASDSVVAKRNAGLLLEGVMDVVVGLGKSGSMEVRRMTGRILLNLVERQEGRGEVLKSGGAKTLLSIIERMAAPASNPRPSTTGSKPKPHLLDPSDLPTLQALAKLLITTNPTLLLGPPTSSAFLGPLTPLLTLLTHPESSLLQIFESLMALTNLTSLSQPSRDRIANDEPIMVKIEALMLGIAGENVMIRRAATELVCNLVGCAGGWGRYTGESQVSGCTPQSVEGQKLLKAAGTRIHLLLALCSVPDRPTQLASSGALAQLTTSPLTCLSILTRDNGLSLVLELVGEDETDEGLKYRGVECLKNLGGFVARSGSKEIREVFKGKGGDEGLKRLAGEEGIVGETAREGLSALDEK